MWALNFARLVPFFALIDGYFDRCSNSLSVALISIFLCTQPLVWTGPCEKILCSHCNNVSALKNETFICVKNPLHSKFTTQKFWKKVDVLVPFEYIIFNPLWWIDCGWMPGTHWCSSLTPFHSCKGERKYTEGSMGWDKDWERSLIKWHHGETDSN